jgi:hypothetical protein
MGPHLSALQAPGTAVGIVTGFGRKHSGCPDQRIPQQASALMSLQASEVFSATHTGGRSRATHARSHPNTPGRRHILAAGRSRATHARSHPNTPGRRHILAAKPLALCNSPTPLELRRQEPAPHRLAVLYKPGLHRPAVPRTPVGAPALRTHRQAPPNQRPVLRSRSPDSYSCVLHLACSLVGLAFSFQLLVAEDLPGGFFDSSLGLLCRTFDVEALI